MKYKNKVRLNDFLSCLDGYTHVKIYLDIHSEQRTELLSESDVRFISFKFLGEYFVQSVHLVVDIPFVEPDLIIRVIENDLPF